MDMAESIVKIDRAQNETSSMDIEDNWFARFEIMGGIRLETDSGLCYVFRVLDRCVRFREGVFGDERFAILRILRDEVVVRWACEKGTKAQFFLELDISLGVRFYHTLKIFLTASHSFLRPGDMLAQSCLNGMTNHWRTERSCPRDKRKTSTQRSTNCLLTSARL